MITLLAPTEHQLHAHYKTSNIPFKVSSLPERHGCDIVAITSKGLVGFQRKTLPDLQASLLDGRLYFELAQLISTGSISYAYLIIESELRRTIDGTLLESPRLSINTVRSIIAKFGHSGVTYVPSSSVADTASAIESISNYVASGTIDEIRRPKQLRNEWGTIDSTAYQSFLLQSFPNIGPRTAKAIIEKFSGVPIAWTVTADELMTVPGIARKTAESLIKSLQPPTK